MDAVATSDPALLDTAAAVDPEPADDAPRSLGRLVFRVLIGWCLIAVITLVIAWATLATGRVHGPSMEPTLVTGDVIVVSIRSTPESGDIVSARVQLEPGTQRQIVKRVIGVEGDVLGYADCTLTVNGRVVEEPYVHPSSAIGSCGDSFEPILVPQGHVWLMGDHRDASTDSRGYGPVSTGDVVGVMLFSF